MKNEEHSGFEWTILLVLLFMGYYYIKEDLRVKENQKCLADYVLVTGKFSQLGVSDVGFNRETVVSYEYNKAPHFVKPFHLIPCRESYVKTQEIRDEILSQSFPVAVSTICSDIAIPLIFPEDYENLGLVFPDSMRTIYDRYLNCSRWEKFIEND